MDEHLSPSARRAVWAARRWATHVGAPEAAAVHLLLAVAEQEESLGATTLAAHGLRAVALRAALAAARAEPPDQMRQPELAPLSEPVREILRNTQRHSLERGPDNPAGTDLLLLELLTVSPHVHELLASLNVDVAALTAALNDRAAVDSRPLSTQGEQLELPDTAETFGIYRILDASANRAREGLRVLEDYVRFVCDDPFLAGQFKELRHQLKESLDPLPRAELLASRDTQHDVGTSLSTAGEWARMHTLDVVAANSKRTQEAMRSLEEFGKLECRPMAETVQQLRYRLYTLERAMLLGVASRERLDGVVLYVLVAPTQCRGTVEWTVREALAGGAQVIQLRAKQMPDGELVALARRVRRWTRDVGALFIMNDRPDLARLGDADGVHVGQGELSVADARRIVGPHALVGISTHSIEQARQAVLDGANYIGVGPVFPSRTKQFCSFPGTDLVRQVHAEIRLPAFAIGGIDLDRLAAVLAAGARRVAVSAAVAGVEDPRAAAAVFRKRLAIW